MNWCNKKQQRNLERILHHHDIYFKMQLIIIFSKMLKIKRATGMENDRCLRKRFAIALITIYRVSQKVSHV